MSVVSRSSAVVDRSAREAGTLLPGLPGWTGRSDVERVELYTRGSLYVVAWFLLAMAALSSAALLRTTSGVVGVLAAVLLCGVLVTVVVRAATRGPEPPGTGRLPWSLLGSLVAVHLGLVAWATSLGAQAATTLVMIGAGSLGWAAGAVDDRRLRWAAVVLGVAGAYVATGSVFLTAYVGGVVLFFAFTVMSSLWLLRVIIELDRARGSQAALAVAEERLRFSRDVHDVLGRQLSVIAVQSELAATLSRRGDPRTAEKILEVRATAHEALREARELARGYRPLDLEQELEGAVSLLRSAGIDADADLSGLPDAWHEPAARVVREAVTNVLRHSDARRVRIRYAERSVVVVDDGSAGSVAAGDGSGLATLRDDLAPLGARLHSGPRADGGFEVRLALAGTGPGEGDR